MSWMRTDGGLSEEAMDFDMRPAWIVLEESCHMEKDCSSRKRAKGRTLAVGGEESWSMKQTGSSGMGSLLHNLEERISQSQQGGMLVSSMLGHPSACRRRDNTGDPIRKTSWLLRECVWKAAQCHWFPRCEVLVVVKMVVLVFTLCRLCEK